ncbi:MAG: hypothetical protein EPN20_18805 [Magnetospirillum sp.]|nr:MAG: hypothetical protein EPN20_18805 [Magnetospirillum sp.]
MILPFNLGRFFRRPRDVSCYFLTGTGRCGTMLLSRILSAGSDSHCNHEHSITTSKMKEAYYTGDFIELNKEVEAVIAPVVKKHNDGGRSYGECSGHLYFVLEEIYRVFGMSTRFALITRRPDEFVRSALARGFFDSSHPHGLEHLRPNPADPVGAKWAEMSPVEKCLWYWTFVNETTLATFRGFDPGISRVVRMEDITVDLCRDLYQFFGIDGFNVAKVADLLEVRINASPGIAASAELNPWSQNITLPPASQWPESYRLAARRYLGPTALDLYPEISNLMD